MLSSEFKIKNTLIILLTIVSLACTKEEEPYECGCDEPFFDPIYIDSLHLEEMPNFWDSNSTIYSAFSSDYMTDHIGFIEGKDYSNKDKYISIYVFQNKDMAIDGVLKNMANLAAYFVPGSENILSGSWWWHGTLQPATYGAIYRVKDNTILHIRNTFSFTIDAVGKEDSLNNHILNAVRNIDQLIDEWSFQPNLISEP